MQLDRLLQQSVLEQLREHYPDEIEVSELELSGPYSQDNKPSSLRWCPVAQLTGAAPVLSVVLRSTNLSTILAPPPL
ncbi:hypothetical protein, partial [Geobacter sp.]|uniref:hypothetical protein n=1 Tax=Geobacter sp. TaxID=46610 RepID=UPI0027B8D2F8